MKVHRLATGVAVWAPAKLNLFFEVLGKRGDGYHEIETLMVPISVFDTLTASLEPSGQVRLDCRWATRAAQETLGQLPPERDNLATKAAALLRTRAGVEAGVRIRLFKRIPSAAGLGGGSSDAAAALLAANTLWQLDWSREALAELSAELGSDVPFFVLGHSAAIGRGRGERLEATDGLGSWHFVVVRPPEGLSTASVYARCRVAQRPRSLDALISALRSGDVRRLRDLIHNGLQEPAEELSPWVARLRRAFDSEDCLAAQMSGSGSAYFGICRHARHARRVARRMHARGLGQVFTASTSN